MNYTIGQRRNVGISGNHEKHFVVGKNVEKNILYIAFGDEPDTLYSDECVIDNLTFYTLNEHTKGEDIGTYLKAAEQGLNVGGISL